MKTMHLWIPDDAARWGRPRVIALGSTPKHPGRLFEVVAANADQARRLVGLTLAPPVDRKADAAGYLDQLDAADRVKELPRG